MNKSAKSSVAFIQNNFLDVLFIRAWQLWFFAPIFELEQYPYKILGFSQGLSVSIVLMVIFAWALGFFAIHVRSRNRWSFQRVRNAPANAFGVWSTLPVGGRNPPRLTRAVVMSLSQEASRAWVWIGRLVQVAAGACLLILVLGLHHQMLPAQLLSTVFVAWSRGDVLWLVLAVAVGRVLREWAVQSRKRLEAGP